MRVAFFGGTFDPIHRGHLAIAKAAAETCALDQVIFAPTGRQPLKSKDAEAPFADRLAMVELVATPAVDARFVSSNIDAPKANRQPNYTVDVLERLSQERPKDRLFAIAGADSFLSLPKWREPERLVELAEWIVVSRPEVPLTQDRIAVLGLDAQQRKRLHVLTNVHEEVSSTELRRRLHTGDPCIDLLPANVSEYIHERGLYRT